MGVHSGGHSKKGKSLGTKEHPTCPFVPRVEVSGHLVAVEDRLIVKVGI